MNKENQNMGRLLPVINFAGTFFYIDARAGEFRQVNASGNTISMKEARATMEEPTELAFDRNTNNIYQDIIDPENIPGHVTMVMVPPLKEFEQVVMAQKRNIGYNAFNRRQEQKRNRNKSGHRL